MKRDRSIFRNLLWFDCIAGASVGLLVLLFSKWLTELYALPWELVLAMGIANLVYASYSFSLAIQKPPRPMYRIVLLAAANMAWTIPCFAMAMVFWGQATPFGQIQLIGEGLFVGILGYLEWYWRRALVGEPL